MFTTLERQSMRDLLQKIFVKLPEDKPTTVRLAEALKQSHASSGMVDRATEGYYDDIKSQHPTPSYQLLIDLREESLYPLLRRAELGEFDNTTTECEASFEEQWNAMLPDSMLLEFGWEPEGVGDRDE